MDHRTALQSLSLNRIKNKNSNKNRKQELDVKSLKNYKMTVGADSAEGDKGASDQVR